MNLNFKAAILSVLITAFLPGCSSDKETIKQNVKDNVEIFLSGRARDGLNTTLNDAFDNDTIFNPILNVEVKSFNFQWEGAKGLAFPSENIEATPDNNFRIASVTKTLTSVRILQLIEEGYFNLDSPITDILFDSDMPEGFGIEDVCRQMNSSCSAAITIRQLLNHTSGLKDFQFDFVQSNPEHVPIALMSAYDLIGQGFDGFSKTQWSPENLLKYYLESGLNAETANSPGTAYYYADTNYLLLGIIIEKVTGLSLAENYEHYVYQPADIVGAYLEWYESPKSGPTMHQYQDGAALGAPVIDVVAAEVNTSADWAGGGIVANANDINLFFNALFSGKLFQHENTLEEMLKATEVNPIPVDGNLYDAAYGLGIVKRTYQLKGGNEVSLYGHTGFYGTLAFYHPETETMIVFALNQGTHDEDWLLRVLESLNKAKLFGL